MPIMPSLITFLVAIGLLIAFSAIRILREYERGVIFRLGRVLPAPKGPGLILLIPFVDKMERIDLRLVTMDVPTQDVITRDNVSVQVNAVVYFRIVDPMHAILEVEHVYAATSQLAQTTLRSVCGSAELDELLAERDKINARIQNILDKQTDPWGVKVALVEVKHIDLPKEMQRAMARQAEAERERRAKVIAAQGELQASAKLTEASAVMSQHPMSLQLRYLQTLVQIAAENNSTTIFPVPLELFEVFRAIAGKAAPPLGGPGEV